MNKVHIINSNNDNIMLKNCFSACLAIPLVVAMTACSTKQESTYPQKLTEWKMAPTVSAVTPSLNAIAITEVDEVIKDPHFSTTNWQRAVVPSTV